MTEKAEPAFQIQKSFRDTGGKRRRASKIVVSELEALLNAQGDGSEQLLDPARIFGPDANVHAIADRLPNGFVDAVLTLEDGIQIAIGPTSNLSGAVPIGLHTLNVKTERGGLASQAVIVAPPKCHKWPRGKRAKILALQLYAVKSSRNWGVGDFRDLRNIIVAAGKAGYQFVALNPLHRLAYDHDGCVSPYSPQSRLLLNWIYLDIESAPGFVELCSQNLDEFGQSFQARLERLREATLVDYEAVAKLKRSILLTLSQRASREGEALCGGTFAEYSMFRSVNGERIRAFTEARLQAGEDLETEVEFDLFSEWCCRRQLDDCVNNDEHIGLFLDLAIGAGGDSPEIRSSVQSYSRGVTIGAPPDSFNHRGQNWNLTPFDPQGLRRTGYARFVELLDLNMPRNGGIRIDHVMWLCRQYWILNGRSAEAGAYVLFPEQELLALVRLMSVRKKCLVLGEDLGTVPTGFRQRLRKSGIYTMHVIRLEREKTGTFRPLSKFKTGSAVLFSTHDLAPLASYVSGSDLDLAVSGGLLPENRLEAERRIRKVELAELVKCLDLPLDEQPIQSELILKWARNAASNCPSQLVIDSLDDLFLEIAPVNIPGTTREYPNWRRKYCLEIGPNTAAILEHNVDVRVFRSAMPKRKRRH